MKRSNWFVNIQSGITVSLISIPLSIALVSASGGTPLQGILAAIYACAIAGLAGGSNYNIFGPAGALTALLATFVMQQGGNPLVLPILSIMVGLIIGIVYFLKIGKYMTLIPSTALHGFIAGVGLTIATGQLNNIFGIADLVEKHSHMTQNLVETYNNIGSFNISTFLLFVVGFCFLILWPKFVKRIPAPIPLTLFGVFFGFFGTQQGWLHQLHIATIKTTYKGMEFALADFGYVGLIQDLFDGLAKPGFFISLLSAACVIAVVAVLETIISAKIADNITTTKHHTQKEIRGLALANIVSGLLGGVPATGVFVRTALNIKSGATSPISAVVAGISVLVISLLLFDFFVYLPMAIIAAILVSISIKLLDIKVWRKVQHYDEKSLWVMLIVALVTWLTDPMYGIVLGTILALMVHIVHLTSESLVVTVMRDGDFYAKKIIADYIHEQTLGDVVIVKLAGEINFMNISCIIEQLEQLNTKNSIVISCRSVTDMDIDAMEQLEQFINTQVAINRDVRLCSLSNHLNCQLSKTLMYQSLLGRQAVYDSTASAIS